MKVQIRKFLWTPLSAKISEPGRRIRQFAVTRSMETTGFVKWSSEHFTAADKGGVIKA